MSSTAGRTAGPLTYGATTIRAPKGDASDKIARSMPCFTADSSRATTPSPLSDTEDEIHRGVSDDTSGKLYGGQSGGSGDRKTVIIKIDKIRDQGLVEELKRSSVWRSTAPGSARIRPERGNRRRHVPPSDDAAAPGEFAVSNAPRSQALSVPRPIPQIGSGDSVDVPMAPTFGAALIRRLDYRGDRRGGHQAPSRPERGSVGLAAARGLSRDGQFVLLPSRRANAGRHARAVRPRPRPCASNVRRWRPAGRTRCRSMSPTASGAASPRANGRRCSRCPRRTELRSRHRVAGGCRRLRS